MPRTIYDAFDDFKQRFLIEKKSIFNLEDTSIILSKDNIDYIIENFIKKPDEGKGDFDTKIKKQLKEAEANVKILFAHAIWLWSIFSSDMKKAGKMKDINKWLPDNKPINDDCEFIFDYGIGSTGQYHKTNKPMELACGHL